MINDVRHDKEGEVYQLVTLWREAKRKGEPIRKTSAKPMDAERIAERADHGEDISAHFTNRFKLAKPAVQRVNVDFTAPMLTELDRDAEALNISRQVVIKSDGS